MALIKINNRSSEDNAIHGRRNLVINGAMQVAQRGTSSTGISTGGYYTVDRYRLAYNGTPDELEFTQEQSTDAPEGFSNSLKLTVTTAETTLAADERIRLQQRIEGQNLQHLKYGTSDAEYLTLSFYVKSNVTGTYGIHFDNRDSSRSANASYTINAANTWEKKTVSIAGDTTGSFDNNNGQSLNVCWVLAAGTDYTSGTLATSWESNTNANNAPSGQADLIDTVSNSWQITGVQLEADTSASDFEFIPKDINLQRCMRYYQIYNYMGNPGSEFGYSLPIRQSSAGNKQWMITTTLPIGVRTSSATLSWDSARTGSAGSAYDGSWLYETTSASNRWTAPTNTFQSKADGDTYSQLFNSISSTITDNTNFTSGETTTFSSRLIVDAEL